MKAFINTCEQDLPLEKKAIWIDRKSSPTLFNLLWDYVSMCPEKYGTVLKKCVSSLDLAFQETFSGF